MIDKDFMLQAIDLARRNPQQPFGSIPFRIGNLADSNQ